MRLWSQQLIPYLPDKQLGGQWVEIRMILGTIAKHGKVNHSTVNYINNHPIDYLYAYGLHVAKECIKRGRYCNPDFVRSYRSAMAEQIFSIQDKQKRIVYPEHNEEYLESCLQNLEGKGIYLRDLIETSTKSIN